MTHTHIHTVKPQKVSRNISAIIPCAGVPENIKTMGPKAMIKINKDETVIGRQIRLLRNKFPAIDIIVVVGFEQEKIIREVRDTARVVINEFYDTTSVVRSLTLGLLACTTPQVIVSYGDCVYSADCLNVLKETTVLLNKELVRDYPSCLMKDKQITKFGWDVERMTHRLLDLFCLSGRELEDFKTICLQTSSKKDNTFAYEVLNEMIKNGRSLSHSFIEETKYSTIETKKDINGIIANENFNR